MTKWIVELEPGVYLADGDGDPARCLIVANAKLFASHPRARIALLTAQKARPFERARVTLPPLPDDLTPNSKLDRPCKVCTDLAPK